MCCLCGFNMGKWWARRGGARALPAGHGALATGPAIAAQALATTPAVVGDRVDAEARAAAPAPRPALQDQQTQVTCFVAARERKYWHIRNAAGPRKLHSIPGCESIAGRSDLEVLEVCQHCCKSVYAPGINLTTR